MKFIKHAVVAALLTASASSFAGNISTNQWYGFCFNTGPGNPATAGCTNAATDNSGNPFTFTLTNPGLLKVTDAFIFGDTFDVFVNSVLAFTTGGGTYTTISSDPDLSFDGGSYDKGSFALAVGNYSVDIITKATPGGTGGAYMEVLEQRNAVPLPGSLSMIGAGLLALALRRRKSV